MATGTLVFAQFNDGAAVLSFEYDDQTNDVTAVRADITSGSLFLSLSRANGQTRTITRGPGNFRTTAIPAQLRLTVDPIEGLLMTRGNIVMSCTWSE